MHDHENRCRVGGKGRIGLEASLFLVSCASSCWLSITLHSPNSSPLLFPSHTLSLPCCTWHIHPLLYNAEAIAFLLLWLFPALFLIAPCAYSSTFLGKLPKQTPFSLVLVQFLLQLTIASIFLYLLATPINVSLVCLPRAHTVFIHLLYFSSSSSSYS